MNIRLSPSMIEQFRKYLDGEYNGYITQEKLLEYVRGETKWKPAMVLGTAYHALIEFNKTDVKYIEGEFYVKTKDMVTPIVFSHKQAEKALVFRNEHPNIVFEVPMSKQITLNGFNIVVSGRADGLEGSEGRDTKTGDKPMDMELWERSYQWRLYCWMAGLTKFHYDIFQFKLDKDGVIETVNYETCSFLPYEGMDMDIIQMIGRFLDFCKTNNLMEFIVNKYAFK